MSFSLVIVAASLRPRGREISACECVGGWFDADSILSNGSKSIKIPDLTCPYISIHFHLAGRRASGAKWWRVPNWAPQSKQQPFQKATAEDCKVQCPVRCFSSATVCHCIGRQGTTLSKPNPLWYYDDYKQLAGPRTCRVGSGHSLFTLRTG